MYSTVEVDTTVEVTVGGGQTVSEYSTYVVTHNGTLYTTKSLPPTTIVVPTTSTTSGIPASSTSSTSPVVTAGASSQQGPAIAFLAGLFGLMALA